MKSVLKSMMAVVGIVIALQAGAGEVAPNLYLLADGLEGMEKWHLYMNSESGKMEIFVDVQCGNDIRHWVEDGSIVVSESGPVMNARTSEVVCFRAGSDNMLPIGGAFPKMYFFKDMLYGCFGTSVSMSVADFRYAAARRPGGVISADFRTRYPKKTMFSFNLMMPLQP